MAEFSSQEDCKKNENQEIDWELIEAEDGQEEGKDEMDAKASLKDADVVHEIKMVTQDALSAEFALESTVEGNGSQEVGWENQITSLGAEGTEEEVGLDGWPKWQEVRQSKRIKAYGGAHQMMEGQAESKIQQNMEAEGDGCMKTYNASTGDFMTLCFGLLKKDLQEQVIQGAEAVKAAALFFHHQDLQAQALEQRHIVPFAS